MKKVYNVHPAKAGSLLITGGGTDPNWKHAEELTDFAYPWDHAAPPFTCFKALHDAAWVYFFFEVEDPHVFIHVEKNDKWEVVSSDRVEIFFRTNEGMNPYYCLEIDPAGRVLDYEASFHRKFNYPWSWPPGQLKIKAGKTGNGYKVEFAVSKKSLHDLGLLSGDRIEAGLYRANCTQAVDAQSHMKWISWVMPLSDTPDFHIPSSFGTLILSD
jgi:hypothetical protein